VEDNLVMAQWVMLYCWQYRVDDVTEITYLFTTPLSTLLVHFPTVTEIRVWRNASPDLVKHRGIQVVLQKALDPGHLVIKHSSVSAMERIRPVEVIGFNMQKISKYTWDRTRNEGLKQVLRDHYSWIVAGGLIILVLPIFLLEDFRNLLV
jgi:hypothetical protein